MKPRLSLIDRSLWPAIAALAGFFLLFEFTSIDLWVQDWFYDFSAKAWLVDDKAPLPRLTILEIVQRTQQRHMTAEDVYKALLSEGADIGLATVYRVLQQFEQAGLLSRNHFETGKAVYELNEGHHHDHLVCLNCGKVEEFFDPGIEDRQHSIARERGFQLQEHSLALYATCVKPDCPNRS